VVERARKKIRVFHYLLACELAGKTWLPFMPQLQPTLQGVLTTRGLLRRWIVKIATLVSMGLILGLAYDWSVPRFYGSQKPPTFFLGMLHGALMPTALPALLMGKDVPIFASGLTPRVYRIGYIAGINLCGMFFFGIAFRQPKKSDE
jgi:hypothetical protein